MTHTPIPPNLDLIILALTTTPPERFWFVGTVVVLLVLINRPLR